MINYRFYSLFLLLSLLFYSCTGSSPSGRRSNQKNDLKYKSNKNQEINNNSNASNTISPTKKISVNTSSLNELYNSYKNSVFLVFTSKDDESYQGSGFFISQDGLAVSNYHVFEGTSKGLEVIKTINGREFKIEKVLESNKDLDFIIFKVDLGSFKIKKPIKVNSSTIKVGDDVFAIGNPRGLESTLSSGIVSSLRDNNRIIQTTAEITHGSSGGPLMNMYGEVIGITTSGLGEANLNFAININLLKLERFLDIRVSDNNSSHIFYSIKKFVDGDTFWVNDGSKKGLKVRLIGVDTPETVHPRKPVEYYGREASNYVKNVLSNQKVRFEFDVTKTDRYGRVLAYVFLEDGTFLNEELVKNGYAQVMTVPPNVKYSEYFLELERKAKRNNLGLWKRQ